MPYKKTIIFLLIAYLGIIYGFNKVERTLLLFKPVKGDWQPRGEISEQAY